MLKIISKMDLWRDESTVVVDNDDEKKTEHPMDILVKDDKKNKKNKEKNKCKHTWKELDKGRVHKKRKGRSYQWFKCSLCKKKQKRNTD